jgi:hypothetical protein
MVRTPILIAAFHSAEWAGQWWTTIAGAMSIGQIR